MIHACVPGSPVVVVGAALAGAIAVVAAATALANGLPAYTNGYAGWKKLNKKPITAARRAHTGVKNVYASEAARHGAEVPERHRDREDDLASGAPRGCPPRLR